MIYNQIVTWTAFAILAMFVRDVPPLVSLAPVVSDVEQYHWPSLGVQCFSGQQEVEDCDRW